jgi:uncharacterized DUF497 family protein
MNDGVRLDPGQVRQKYRRARYDFADVVVGFADPMKKAAKDDRRDYGEERFNMLAMVEGRLFHVTLTGRGTITWIISARKANKREQRRYEKN